MPTFTSLLPHLSRHASFTSPDNAMTSHVPHFLTALAILSRKAPEYDFFCTRSTLFFEHFCQCIPRDHLTVDDTFSLLEDMLIFIREKTLRAPCRHTCEQEKALLFWTESGQEWNPTDGSLFSHYYFYEIPLIIVKGVLAQLEDV